MHYNSLSSGEGHNNGGLHGRYEVYTDRYVKATGKCRCVDADNECVNADVDADPNANPNPNTNSNSDPNPKLDPKPKPKLNPNPPITFEDNLRNISPRITRLTSASAFYRRPYVRKVSGHSRTFNIQLIPEVL